VYTLTPVSPADEQALHTIVVRHRETLLARSADSYADEPPLFRSNEARELPDAGSPAAGSSVISARG
jgi:hypothetical protein